jgi:predicted amidohydrolase
VDERVLIGILHLDIRHRDVAGNRASLLRHAEEAAVRGARIIVAPELALSGYRFESMDEIIPYTETVAGETLTALARVADRFGVYICTGFAERDERTGVLFNSAVVLGPDGTMKAHHRKQVAERRWSCPGQPSGSSIFETPWGKVGVLICADTYYGLLPRSFALHGADLVLVCANWPPVGIDPREVWRARALENGIGIVAANRTGMDKVMDCRTAPSYAATPEGEVLLDRTSGESRLFLVEYPLEGHRFPKRLREETMALRRPWDYNAIALDGNGLEDFPGVWGVPSAGTLTVRCIVPPSHTSAIRDLVAEALPGPGDPPTLIVVPPGAGYVPVTELVSLVGERAAALVTETSAPSGMPAPVFLTGNDLTMLGSDMNGTMVDFGPARIGLARPEALRHPEQAVALSKQGCDLVVSCTTHLSEDDRLMFGIKSLERLVVAVSSPDAATICEPPEGHERWRETARDIPGICGASFETGRLRKKRFLDRVDLEALLWR